MISPLQLTRGVLSLNRLRHVAQVLTRHGFGHFVERVQLARFVPGWILRKKPTGDRAEQTGSAIGRRLTQVCSELGPTFVKLGQMMSTRPDIVPADILRELRKLQDDVPPFDTSQAMQVIAEEFSCPVSDSFASIEETPIASGSIGQVYRATDADGNALIVKVRRPGIEDTIKHDIQLLRWLAESIESVMPELRAYRPQMLVSELEETLVRELDYINEASATDRFYRAFEQDGSTTIPKVHWNHCGQRVLTVEAIDGINVQSILTDDTSSEPAFDRKLIARRLTDAFLKQIFELGSFHADPHPGNILIKPAAEVCLIDFGQVGTITDEMMTHIVVMVFASVNQEFDVVVDSLDDLGALGPETNRRQLIRSLQALVQKYHGLPLKHFNIGTLITEFLELVRRHDIVVPKDVVMLLKAIGLVAGLAARLDPDLNVLDLLEPKLTHALKDRFSPGRMARVSATWGWNLLTLIKQGPRQLRNLLQKTAGDGIRLNLRHENLDRLTRELDRSSNRLAFSIVIAAIIVGSSVVVSAATELTLFNLKVQYFGIVGYLVAGVFGLGLAWAIFRSGRLH